MQEDQLQSHEGKLKQMSVEVEEHRKNPPSPSPKSREWEEYRIKEHYLIYEVRSREATGLWPTSLCIICVVYLKGERLHLSFSLSV